MLSAVSELGPHYIPISLKWVTSRKEFKPCEFMIFCNQPEDVFLKVCANIKYYQISDIVQRAGPRSAICRAPDS